MAVGSYGCSEAIKDGRVPVEGIDLRLVEVQPIIAAFRRMVRNLEFDICELAPTTYVVARFAGVPITALPIFVSRRFHHSGLLVRPDSGIGEPKDLEGKRLGVRAYSVTTGVWTRGILMNEYGVDNDAITWFVDDEEHVQSLRLPDNVQPVPEGMSLADMLAQGRLDGGFGARAGIGRKGAPTSGWEAKASEPPPYRELFEDAPRLEAEWYRRTGIYPVHGCIVVKTALLEEHPFLARSLFEAFEEAKTLWLDRLRTDGPAAPDHGKYADILPLVVDDPLPNGLDANRATLEALVTYAWQQGLIPERPPIEALFLDPR
ncbi:ABC transporter substrate-binding protein [Mangrovibrevibacter kandeliae]|uniref:ABC transporter substrate-binding protein n=1 Tax=Mangrovibrevibacter kandeliae TaxID=2968473 RepID=UPI00211991E6|nr:MULTISPECIES: PhnD/SsuA/transferrin family substrate-binding protein [unclassified Aurantimonas]MCQ8781566.1 ABC transporter substrate-binding protein [Aurantimonas sp. CSK15Z-1]MCW4114340.1 ABC transporter substrate-binding protein [Aurantimonas sp. MSK8Z-1]